MSDGGPGGGPTRISYLALRKGVPVNASGGERIGEVEHVLQIPELDVFDGIVIRTSQGLRFAEAAQVDDITEQYVTLAVTAEQAAALPAPSGGAPSYHADAFADSGTSLHDHFGRLFGRAHWKRDDG